MNYTVEEVLKNVYQTQEPEGFSSTLVVGTKRALLFDTMSGRGDLKALVRGLTALPLCVVNSHGHYDHIAGNVQFDRCYMHGADRELLRRAAGRYPGLSGDLKAACARALDWMAREGRVQPVCPGARICLGNLDFEVISLQGHTPGSIGLYCESLKLLLSGDAFTPQTCLFFPESLPVSTYIETIDRAMKLDFTHFIAGHQRRMFEKDVLLKFRACAQLVGTKKGMRYEYSLNPAIKGRIYILDTGDETLGEMICLIDKCGEREDP